MKRRDKRTTEIEKQIGKPHNDEEKSSLKAEETETNVKHTIRKQSRKGGQAETVWQRNRKSVAQCEENPAS